METKPALGAVRGLPIGPVESFDGTQIHVEEIGSGPTLVLAHGFCLQIASWHYQMLSLAQDFRLVLYDQRGHGRSARPATDDWSMEAFARDLDAVIEATCDDGAVLVGHSMGGMTALEHARLFGTGRHGDRIRALALVDTTDADVIGGIVPSAARMAMPAVRMLEEAAVRAATRSPEGFQKVRTARADLVQTMVRLMGFGPKADRDHVRFVGELLGSTPPDVLVWVFQTLRRMNVSAALHDIDIPTLVIVGSRDRLTPRAAAHRIAGGIHHARLAVVQGAGHMPMLERPGEFDELLGAFARHPGASFGGRAIPLR